MGNNNTRVSLVIPVSGMFFNFFEKGLGNGFVMAHCKLRRSINGYFRLIPSHLHLMRRSRCLCIAVGLCQLMAEEFEITLAQLHYSM